MIREEGHYSLKRVDILPKRGNANLLYSIKSEDVNTDSMAVLYRWLPEGKYQTITVGGAGEGDGSETIINAGTNITLTGTGTTADPYIINSAGGVGTASETLDIGTVIPVDNVLGHNCNFGTANTNTSFTIDSTNSVINAWTQVLINTATEPSITGADQEGGIPWVTATDLYLTVRDKGSEGLIYYYTPFTISSGGGTTLIIPVEDDGVEIISELSKLNFTGAGVSVTDGGSGEAIININGASIEDTEYNNTWDGNVNGASKNVLYDKIKTIEYDTVSSIPSFITPDNTIIIDNGDTTYDILKFPGANIPMSYFSIVADLRYEDVTITNGSSVITGSFTSEDVGKRVSVRYGYQNPDTGTPITNTPLGKMVTVDEVILSVVDGTSATITTSLNLTKSTKAYIYTDNYANLQNAINFCIYQNKALIPDLKGIAGVRTYDKSSKALVLDSQKGPVHLKHRDGFSLKLCDETNNNNKALFFIANGDEDIIIDTVCIPPDFASTALACSGSAYLSHTGESSFPDSNAGSSARDITITNIGNFKRKLLNGGDGHWSGLIGNSLGGVNNTDADLIEYQRFFLKGTSVRTRAGGISCFSQNGATNQIYVEGIDIQFSNHYEGEVGRDSYTSLIDNNGEWTFTYDITKSGTTLTVESGVDFTWEDYVGSNGTEITVNSVNFDIVSITDSKNVVVSSETLTNATYTGFVVHYNDQPTYAHPVYLHPNVAYEFIDCKCTFGSIRFYSSGGQSGTPLFNKIINCNFDTPQGLDSANNSDYIGIEHYIENSTIQFDNVGNYEKIITKNSTLKGGLIRMNEFESLGGNTFNFLAVVNNTTNFTSIDDTLNFAFTAGITFDNDSAILKFIDSKITTATVAPYTGGEIYFTGGVWENYLYIRNAKSTSKFYFNEVQTPHKQTAGLIFTASTMPEVLHISETCSLNKLLFPDFTDLQDPLKGTVAISKARRFEDVEYTKTNAFRSLPPCLLQNDVSLIGLNTQRANKFKIDNYSFNSILLLGEGDSRGGYFTDDPYGHTALYYGELELEIGASVVMNPFFSNTVTATYFKRDDATLGNIVVKSIDRVEGEVVKFKVDSKFGRLVEVSSTVDKKFVDVAPTRKGVQNEVLYDTNNNVRYVNNIVYEDLAGTITTETLTSKTETFSIGNVQTDSTTKVINLSHTNLSIFQEKTDGSDLMPLSFKIILDDATELTFTNQTTFSTRTLQPQLVYNFWAFKDATDTYACYINNITGELVFESDYSITLAGSNNFEIITGHRISSEGWVTELVNKEYLFSNLPTGVLGMRAYITDSGAVTYGAIATGGGSITTSVFFDGTNWIYQ